MIGAPSDTYDTLDKIKEFGDTHKITPITTGFLVPYPGTPLYEYYEKNKLLLTKDFNLYHRRNMVYKHDYLKQDETMNKINSNLSLN